MKASDIANGGVQRFGWILWNEGLKRIGTESHWFAFSVKQKMIFDTPNSKNKN